MHWCAVISAKPIVLFESSFCAFLTRLSVWQRHDQCERSRERQREKGRWICWLCSGALGTGRHRRLVLRHRARFLVMQKGMSFLFVGEGLSLQAKQRSAPPKKPRACLSQAPTKRGVCASLPAALLPVDATHVATAPGTPAAISAKPPAVAGPTGVTPGHAVCPSAHARLCRSADRARSPVSAGQGACASAPRASPDHAKHHDHDLFWWRRLIHSKGARTAAASTPIGPRARL
jgi:hypothetical protein